MQLVEDVPVQAANVGAVDVQGPRRREPGVGQRQDLFQRAQRPDRAQAKRVDNVRATIKGTTLGWAKAG